MGQETLFDDSKHRHIGAKRSVLWPSKYMPKCVSGRGSAPDVAGGASQTRSWLRRKHPTRDATTSSKSGVPIPWSRVLLPFYKKIVYPVWCSRLHNHTLFIKKLRKKLGVRLNLGVPDPGPPSGCAHGIYSVLWS